MYCVALIVYDDPKSRFSGLQTFPFFFQMLFDGSTFAFKCQKIKKFYVEIDEAFLKVNGQASFYHSYKYFLIYATVNGVLGFISCVGGSLLFLFSGRPAVLTYAPYNDGFCFYIIWTLQASFFAYSGVLNFLMDAFINGMLVSLSSYVKAVRIYLKKKEIHDMREMIELDLELRGFMKTYEELFSSLILFRGLVAILSISSNIFELLKGLSKETVNIIVLGSVLMFRLLFPTFYGSEIQYEYNEFSRDLYEFNWIDAKICERKNFIIIQENLKNKFRLTAAKIFPINLKTFLKIINATYSFYAVLKEIRN